MVDLNQFLKGTVIEMGLEGEVGEGQIVKVFGGGG